MLIDLLLSEGKPNDKRILEAREYWKLENMGN